MRPTFMCMHTIPPSPFWLLKITPCCGCVHLLSTKAQAALQYQSMAAVSDEIMALVKQWLSWDRNSVTRAEVENLVEKKDNDNLRRLLSTRMEFGTAGLRAAMGAGTSQMNDVTVIQAAQGLAAYLAQHYSAADLSERGVVIGFDARHNSSRFARLSANVFLSLGVKVYLFRDICCTPFVPFTVRTRRCVAGVMVTASHNPKQDNGYKVYWSNGAQIISPHDAGIAKCIEDNLDPLSSAWETQPGALDLLDEIQSEYLASLLSLSTQQEAAAASETKFTYTAMHGVGTRFTTKALEAFGVRKENIVLVAEQVEPDPEFPTVAFPNPEEGKSALNLAMATADRANSRVILANDPDADRLAVAEKQRDGAWRVFTGNHIGALFGWWALECYRRGGGDLSKAAMVSSAVSSMILRSIASKEGFYFEETLTGFKWMGSRSEVLEREQGKQVLFAFEEAIGFMCGTRVYDKDGVTAAAVMSDIVHYLEKHEGSGKLLSDKLTDIYATYGFHASYNSYVISRDPRKTQEMFDSMRTLNGGSYPDVVAGAKVKSIRDLSVGLDTSKHDRVAALPSSKVSPMITFFFENGVAMTIRGSGTEPKVKWYSEIISSTSEGMEEQLVSFVTKAVEELMRPAQFGFLARPT